MPRLRAVAPGVLVATSRRDQTTSTVVAADGPTRRRHVLVVDPAWDPDELADLSADLVEGGLVVDAGLATHAHYDHLLWHPALGPSPRFASAETARRAQVERADLIAGLGPAWPALLTEPFGRVEATDGPILPWGGPEVVLVVHDAHIPGHTAAWIPELGLLVAGDMLSDVELPLPDSAAVGSGLVGSEGGPPADPLAAYVDGLERLAPYVARATLVVPGHGMPIAGGLERLDADRRYLEAVMSGRRVNDARLRHPGMVEAHRATVALAQTWGHTPGGSPG